MSADSSHDSDEDAIILPNVLVLSQCEISPAAVIITEGEGHGSLGSTSEAQGEKRGLLSAIL